MNRSELLRMPGARYPTFLQAHWECLTATDFLSVEMHTFKGLVTFRVGELCRSPRRD
jgi:hypothetical protein